jgi:LEA14-like dessication related protein
MSHRINKTLRLAWLAAVLFLCVACGPQVIKGQSPFIGISSMSLSGARLSAVFDIRNPNDVPMTIRGFDISITVNDADLARENLEFELTVGARSAEEVEVEEMPDEFARSLLDSLTEGELKSLPFDLVGWVNTVEDGFLSFSQRGHLYPVPGKPGYFRSAVTQTKELQRKQQY